jgi:hypothetical protein
MPFTLEDLDRIKIRVGTSDKMLRDMSDNQFTAWLRHIGAKGDMTVIKVGPGKYMTPIEDRIRILNELEASGFQIPGVMAAADVAAAGEPAHDPRKLHKLQSALATAAANIEVAQGLAQELGEIDPRVNLRQSLAGSLALMDAARGATERAIKANES